MKLRIPMTYELAMAASADAATARQRREHRSCWNLDDWNEACRVFDSLWPSPKIGTKER